MLISLLKKREIGFTLIELLTVIIIIGILAAIAIPVFSAQKSRAQDSQTVADVRNIVTATETYLSDRTKSVADITGQSVIEYASSKNVLWNISGNTATGGYCIAAFNTNGKDYKSTSTLLTYDSTNGGLKKSGGSCGTTTAGGNTPTPTTSTAVGSSTVSAVNFTNLSLSRSATDSTSVVLSWTAPNDTTVSGYRIEKSTDGTNFSTLTTLNNRVTNTYTDSSAGNSHIFYRVTPTVSSGTANTLSAFAFAGTSGISSKTGTVQTFTVPANGTYKIETWGAAGGQGGGAGGYVNATHTLVAGTQINVVVGSLGFSGYYGAGGGGGTFVYATNDAEPLQVSGGGGGGSTYYGAGGGSAVTTAGSGNGGAASESPGGAGWKSNGNGGGGGLSKPTWSGGTGSCAQGSFGGGGAGGNCGAGGGGGGYTGGNGSSGGGGRGGSNYYAPTANLTENTGAANGDSGKVLISQVG